ncbi:MAG: Cys-every-fifth RiPP peptide CefA [Thiothrix sp.]|uniref:Cys-every-fifth RiPP peptide CefA n=1 Tax=Thiothrix sp. TaxID=1032 RepID=UPI00261F853F|nr:Cys-every-fifth RiPP peptide CefA [Thiothrix sp.]MDD5394245.1 Cys-every-fifth RiPP peptide CefA [Thiothrix sp.]
MKYLVQPLAPHSVNSPLVGGNQDQVYAISSAYSGFALTADARSAQIKQYKWNEATNQQWKIVANSDGTYRIQNIATNQSMDVYAFGGQGAKVYSWDSNDANNQRWRITEVQAGHFRIEAVHSGLALDLGTLGDGGEIITYPWHGNLNQLWILSAVRSKDVAQELAVTIYQGDNYTGANYILGIGSYDINDLSMYNDDISSVRVPQGLEISLYQHPNFRGEVRKYTADTPRLESNVDNQASSAVVQKVITFYEHTYYRGSSATLGVGVYKDATAMGLPDNTISSLRVPYGMLVTLYEYPDFQGDFRTYYSDCAETIVANFNDKASSIIVKQMGVVVPKGALRFGDKIQLKTAHGKWMTETNGNVRADAASNAIGETFTLVRSGPTTTMPLASFGDIVSLKTQHNTFLSATAGGDVTTVSSAAGTSEQWQVIRAGATASNSFMSVGDKIAFKSVPQQKYLVAEAGGDANANRAACGAWETFEIIRMFDNSTAEGGPAQTYTISPLSSGLVLTAEANDAQVRQRKLSGAANQQWKFVAHPDGTYRILNAANNQSMDVYAFGNVGAKVYSWASNDANNQRWKITEVQGGKFRIEALHSGLALDLSTTGDGGEVSTYPWNGGLNQLWALSPVEGSISIAPAGSGATSTSSGGAAVCGAAVCGAEACGADLCGADACGADACGADACAAAACGAAATLIGACGAAVSVIALCGADVAGAGACGAAACGAALAGIAACGADACGAAACGAAACGAAACGAAACGGDACGGDVCGAAVAGATACAAKVSPINACGADACAANVCAINLCPADACAADACAVDLIPIIPGI